MCGVVRQDKRIVVDPRMLEAWSRLLKNMRTSADMMEMLLPFAGGQSREQLSSLLGRAGAAGSGSGLSTAAEPIEQFWYLLWLVPRYRYDELQERYEALRTRLEEAEVTIQRLRRLMDERGREPEARRLLDSWGSALSETLKMQAGMMRSISGLSPAKEDKEPAARRPRTRRPRPKT
jgi:hypothetical protein